MTSMAPNLAFWIRMNVKEMKIHTGEQHPQTPSPPPIQQIHLRQREVDFPPGTASLAALNTASRRSPQRTLLKQLERFGVHV